MIEESIREHLERDGCTLVKLHLGSEAYFKMGELVARQCNKCMDIKLRADFNKRVGLPADIKSICRACTIIDNKKYREENKAKIRKSSKIYREENKVFINSRVRKYKKDNAKKIREADRKYREENKEAIAARQKDWYLRNPMKARLPKLRRRARLALLPETFTKKEYDMMMQFFSYSCALSGEIDNLHNDHAIPLATGFGGTTKYNIIPLKAELNLSKNDSNFFTWFEENKARFNLSQEMFDKAISYLAGINGMTTQEYKDYVYQCHDGRKGGEGDWYVS